MKKQRCVKFKTVREIHFGPGHKELPPDVKQAFKEANDKTLPLYRAAFYGPHKNESVDQLIELGAVISTKIKDGNSFGETQRSRPSRLEKVGARRVRKPKKWRG